ncbi:MAG: hypothetical protein K2L78_01150, partial [Muribaculaceae bacterium]|nr:hypothetical protein [Muribaculaceae bacterium]
ADGYYHFNWGWGGDYDGYFLLTSLNPEGQGIGGYAGGYNLFQSIVLGVRKPGGTPVNIPLQLSQSEVLSGNVTGNWLSLTGGWYNETGSSMRMALGIKVEPVEGTEGGTIYVDSRNYADITLENGYGWRNSSFQFDISGVPDGTYKVSMVTKNTALPAQGWTPTLCRMNQAGYVILKKGAVSTVSSVNPGVLDVSSASLLTGLYIRGYAKLNMSVANNSEFEVAEALAPALQSGNSLVAMGAGIYFDLLPGESSDRDLVFQFAYTKAFKTNTNYTLCLLNPETYEVRHIIGTVKVLDDPGTLRLSATSFALEGGTTAVDCGKNLRFTADVKCLAGYMAMPVSVAVTPKDGGATLAYGYSSEPLFIEVGQTASAEISLPFSEGVPGTTYTAYLCYEDDNGLNPLRSMTFTVGTAGVDTVTAAGNGVEISYDRASRRAGVSAAAGVKAVKAFSATGAELAVPVEMTGNNAVLDFSNAGTGIVIVTAVDAAGESETAKFVL